MCLSALLRRQLTSRRLLTLVFIVGLACVVAGPERPNERTHKILFSAWLTLGDRLLDHDLAVMADQLDQARARTDRAKVFRQALAEQLEGMRVGRRDAKDRGDGNRVILRQIANLLKQPGSIICVDALAYDRDAIERDGERYFRLCQEGDAEVAHLERAIGELAAGVVEADQSIQAAEVAVRRREVALARFRARAERQRLCRELAALNGNPSSEATREPPATLMEPSSPMGERGRQCEDLSASLTERLTAYLEGHAPGGKD